MEGGWRGGGEGIISTGKNGAPVRRYWGGSMQVSEKWGRVDGLKRRFGTCATLFKRSYRVPVSENFASCWWVMQAFQEIGHICSTYCSFESDYLYIYEVYGRLDCALAEADILKFRYSCGRRCLVN